MDSSELLLLLAAHLALTGVPWAVGILGFWSYYGDPLVGEAFSYLAQ